MTKKLLIGIALVFGAILTIWACTKIDVRPTTQTNTTTNNQTSDSGGTTGGGDGGGGGGGGGDDDNPVGSDNFTYLYTYGSNYVRYTPIANKFEKVSSLTPDANRQMMPLQINTWSIANFRRDKLIFGHMKLKDNQGNVLFEWHDTEGAVHVVLAQNERELQRGNNHQAGLGWFLMATGTYTLEYETFPNSMGIPYLEGYEQYEGQIRLLVGANLTGNLQHGLEESERLQVPIGTTISRTFTVDFFTGIINFDANGFEHN